MLWGSNTLKGQFYEDEFIYFLAELYMCDNITSNNTCQTQEYINKYLSQMEVVILDLFT